MWNRHLPSSHAKNSGFFLSAHCTPVLGLIRVNGATAGVWSEGKTIQTLYDNHWEYKSSTAAKMLNSQMIIFHHSNSAANAGNTF